MSGRETNLRREADRLGWIVARVVVENDLGRKRDGKVRPASAFKRRMVRDERSGEIVRDPDTGKPLMRVIRPGWQSVIADLKTGRASAVLAEDLDRALRDPRDLLDLLDACEATGASARSLTGSLTITNGGTETEQMVALIMVSQAKKSSADTARRIRDAKVRYHGQSYNGGLRPFGYAHVTDTDEYHRELMLVPDEADQLRAAAADVLERDISLAAIAREWNGRGSVTVTGKPWTARGVRGALIKPTIAGLAVLHGVTKPAETWEPIIDPDVWERLRAKLEDADRRTITANEPRYLVSGIALCGICDDGTTLRVTGTVNRPGGPGYTCSNGGTHLRRNTRHVDLLVESLIVEWLTRHGRTVLKPPPRAAGINAPMLRREAKRLQGRKVQQMKLHAAGDIDDADLAVGMREIRDRIAVITAQLAISDQPDPLAEFRDAPAEAVWKTLSLPRKRALVRRLMVIRVLPTTHRGPGFDRAAIDIQPAANLPA